ncbi:MAG: hypothetical protein K2J77_10530 [Oscillospiraceae bacterium]|nr:hypothetical protein [Oscillospiraceae bacterium]
MANQFNCPNCGGALNIDPHGSTVECPFCGSRFPLSELLGESDSVKIERIRRDVELGRQNLELERMRQAEAEIERTETAKKSVLGKVAMVIAVISLMMCISAFVQGALLVGCIAAAQFVLLLVTFLMGQQIISVKNKKLLVLPFALALLLYAPFSYSVASSKVFNPPSSNEIIAWDEIVLGDRLPTINSDSGYVSKNTRKDLMMNVYNVPLKQYYDFVEGCKDLGFTVDGKEEENSYIASADDGFMLRLHYRTLHDGMVVIELAAPN